MWGTTGENDQPSRDASAARMSPALAGLVVGANSVGTSLAGASPASALLRPDVDVSTDALLESGREGGAPGGRSGSSGASCRLISPGLVTGKTSGGGDGPLAGSAATRPACTTHATATATKPRIPTPFRCRPCRGRSARARG